MKADSKSHPYMPNSAPDTKQAMLDYLGLSSVDDLFSEIPEQLRFRGELKIEPTHRSEADMRRHVTEILQKNVPCHEVTNFRGGGCWQHYVPSVCDEMLSRGEFLTAYTGSRHANLGSFQAQFEYQSLMAELVGLDAVSYVTYDWGSAASVAIGMARRLTGRNRVLLPDNMDRQRLRQIQSLGAARTEVSTIESSEVSGKLDLDHLRQTIGKDTAAVYIEIPAYLGFLETRIHEIADIAHSAGALFIVGVDPISLGILEAPANYGADLICGSIQPLGIHMFCGGGLAGFLAMPDDDEVKSQCPWPMLGLLTTERENEYTYGWVNFDTTPYELRDKSEDFIGTGQTIWALIAGVYLTLMGPRGMQEIGQTIMQRAQYAATKLNELDGVKAPLFDASHFKEFVVQFDTDKSVAEINAELKKTGILGGIDLSITHPDLGNSALYCVTELHRKDDIDNLVTTLRTVL